MGGFIETQTGSGIYDLIGVVRHYGQLNRGHYRSVALNSAKQKWLSFDDENVEEISEAGIVDSSAYVLFYQRREEPVAEPVVQMPYQAEGKEVPVE